MHFCLQTRRPLDDLNYVGIALRLFGSQPHVGVLYRKSENEVIFCHLATHHDLRKDQLNIEYFWNACQWLDDDDINGPVVAARFDSLKQQSQIPYGFAFEPACFDNNLEYQAMPIGMGLTCASFIIAIFHSLELPIINLDTWKSRPEDETWQREIVQRLMSINFEAARTAAMHVGSFRYKPEEVASAATAAKVPVDYNFAVSRAKGVLDDLALA